MKYFIIIIFFITNYINGYSQSKLDINATTRLLIDYTNNWSYNIKGRYSNYDLLKEIIMVRSNEEYKANIIDSLYFKTNQLFISDTTKIEGYNFSYKAIKKIAKKKLTLRIAGLKWKQKGKGKYYTISTPIFTLDNNIALIYLRTYCGPLCGGDELFILEKVCNKWQIKDRKFRSIS
jgi:hypothetical protein